MPFIFWYVKYIIAKRNDGWQSKRNQVVHGVHKKSEKPGHISLTMVRYDEPKRTQDVSLNDIHELVIALSRLSDEAWAIADDYGIWKFGTGCNENGDQKLVKTETSFWIEIMQNTKSAFKRIFGNG